MVFNEVLNYRNNDLHAIPDQLAPIYVSKFLKYYDSNPALGIECFGLNCAPPEAILDSLQWMFNEVDQYTSG